MDKASALQIQNILETTLEKIQIPLAPKEYDQEFHNACLRGAEERGICLQGPVHIGLRLPAGVVMGSIAYGHLPDLSTRIFIALYTAGLLALEDVCGDDPSLLSTFCDRFFKSIPHGHPVVDAWDILTKELPLHFDRVQADIMRLSSMDFVLANFIEFELQHKTNSSHAQQFPVFLRNITGLAKPFAIFIFPRTIPFTSYVETVPAAMNFINFINDIFSFYKEELANETVNCISNIARCNGQTRLEACQYLADESVKAHKEILAVLDGKPEALAAYQTFATGYVDFHTLTKRYKIEELWQMAADAK
ncbi:hypothetical protein APHAL10511_005344 [Amanita phalloides]|nr:hypothetical protein APHAL10511_005344 [Amanita phalloides]